jgi:hypothetical protein
MFWVDNYLVAKLGLVMLVYDTICCVYEMLFKNRQDLYFKSEHGEPPKIKVQPQSTWLWLSQIIRCVTVLVILSERNTGGSGLKGYSPVLLG